MTRHHESVVERLTVGSLFSGIGGFDLGFERAGFEIRWQVEIDDYATRVLEQHWPHVRRFGDVRECVGYRRDRYGYIGAHAASYLLDPVDVMVGGFPCQPHSVAGRRQGAADSRDLWPEFRRLIRELEPRWVVAENVPGLLSNDDGRFFGDILRDLAESGYDAEWDCVPASAFGAPHIRDRVWLVAYPRCIDGDGRPDVRAWRGESNGEGLTHGQEAERPAQCGRPYVADTDSAGPQERFVFTGLPPGARQHDDGQDAAVGDWWAIEPAVGRVAHGIPARVDRLRGLGNAIVPQIAEWIARRILDAERLAA